MWKDLTFKFEEFLDVVIPVRLKKGREREREDGQCMFLSFSFYTENLHIGKLCLDLAG